MFKKIVLQTCMLCHVLGMCPKGFMKEERMNYQGRRMLWRPAAWMFAAGYTFILSGPGIGWANTELPKEPVLPLRLAQKAANAALAKCEEGRYKVSVAVVDRGGNVKVLLRGDGAGPHTQDSSARKAYTASSIFLEGDCLSCWEMKSWGALEWGERLEVN
jgi:hypothetical protein